jgi:hypothetical protein
MSTLLTAFPYPWQRSDAQQLHTTLTQLYPSGSQAVALASRAGLNAAQIFAEQSPYAVWNEILTLAAAHGHLPELVQQAHDLLAPSSPRRPFLASLLADAPQPLAAELDGTSGSHFIYANDAVSEPEALLYYDDLTIPMGQLPALVTTLNRLLALAPAVCRLLVTIDGESQYGTAFRIGQNWLLTNWHVLYNHRTRQGAATVMAEFGYEDGQRTSTAVPCEVASIRASEANDWAIIQTAEPLADTWPIVPLDAAVQPTLNAATYIIQHPGGTRKRLGYVRNQLSYFNQRIVHYLTDTQAGSSGAPVFNSHGELLAVHHFGGQPQTVLGKAPLKKNEGIRISCILRDFAQQGIMLA